MKKKISLPVQILIALAAGIAVGLACLAFAGGPEFTTNYLKPFGDIFVNLLKFIVVPVVLLSMIDGILSMDDMKKVGAVGWKTVAYFLVTTAIACVIGLAFANIFNAAGLFPKLALEDGAVWEKATSANFMDTLKGIFPDNMWASFHSANMLQVIVIALLLGGSIMAAKEKGRLCRDFVSSAYAVIEKLMGFIISLSPIGVFTMMAWVVATQGPKILGSLTLVLLCAYLGYIVHAVLVYSMSAKVFAGMSPLKFFKAAFPAMMFAFTSTSSAATLPVSKECADELGAEDGRHRRLRPAPGLHHQYGRHRHLPVRGHHLPGLLRRREPEYRTDGHHRGHRHPGLHRHRRRIRRGHDYAGHGADRYGHRRQPDYDHLRRGPPVRYGPHLPERHRRHCLLGVRYQVGGRQEGCCQGQAEVREKTYI